jgi:CHAT domain-containing protein
MGDVVAAVPRGSEVVLVAVGALGLLPLHAATDPEDGSAVCDRIALRYVPNASMAAAARQVAHEQDRRPGPVLVVAVPAAPGQQEIRGAKDEAVAVARGYGDRARTLLDAPLDDVLAALPRSAVWHLACHGTAVVDRPLESALFLHDGELRLRDVLAMPPGGHRLAVLSACRSATPDPARLDEVVGFPAGLLQAGVAGVVSTQWVVGDDAAHVITVRFHQHLRSGESPARALARAQSWVRTATNADVMAELGPDYRPPDGLPAVALSDPGWQSQRPFVDPALWATFAMTGA